MARAGRFRIEAIGALWAQLQFAPAAASQRMVSRIRSFIATVGPDSLHSPAHVVREIVRFPVEQVPGDADAMFVGQALRADLAELYLRLSRRVPAKGGDAMSLAEAARERAVSVRTLRRWRERGLLLHWIEGARGTARVGVLRGDLDAFVRSNADQVARAARFTQLSARERSAIRDAVRALAGSGLSERRAIAGIARDHGRAPGTVRALVVPVMERSRAASRRAEQSEARAAKLWRSWCRGIPVGACARRMRITERVAQHALRRERARRLGAMQDFLMRDAHGLDPSLVTEGEWATASSGLAVSPVPLDAEGWLAMSDSASRPRPRSGTLAVVMRALLSRAAMVSERAAARPLGLSAAALDRAETDVRWAARILLTLTIDAMPAIDARVRLWRASTDPAGAGAAARLRRLQGRSGGASLPPEFADLAITSVLEACASDISSLRSGRTRIERLASANMDLALARAGGSLKPDGPPAARAMERAAPWTALAPLHDARAVRRSLASALYGASTPQGMAQRRYGWHGGAPSTIDAIAHDAQRPAWVVAATISRALHGRTPVGR